MDVIEHIEYDLLYKVNSPADLKKLSIEELKLYCREVRQYIIEECSKNPGHLASSLGTIELTVAIHYVYDTPHDKLVWDVGHQAYAHKIITGRRDLFPPTARWAVSAASLAWLKANTTRLAPATHQHPSRPPMDWQRPLSYVATIVMW